MENHSATDATSAHSQASVGGLQQILCAPQTAGEWILLFGLSPKSKIKLFLCVLSGSAVRKYFNSETQ
jgi:hypothetical protein